MLTRIKRASSRQAARNFPAPILPFI